MLSKTTLLFLGTMATLLFSCGGNTATSSVESKDKDSTEVIADSGSVDTFDAGLKIALTDYHAEKCFEDAEVEELSCASTDVAYLQVTMDDAMIAQRINDAIFEAVTEEKAQSTTLKKWVDKIKKITSQEEVMQTEITCSRITQTKDLLVIGIMNYSYAYMAAHPNTFATYLNFDLRTGKLLSLDDLLKPSYKKRLIRAAENCFIAENGGDSWDFTPKKGDFFLSEDFAITPDGFLFPYDAYEIGPYVAGAPNALVPYSQILGFIPEKSPLNAFMKPGTSK